MAKRGGNGGGPSLVGKGACRGPGWQDGKNWPVVMPVEVKGIEACGQACARQPGCTAFDVRPDGSACLLYGHATVNPGLATNSIFFLFPFCKNSLICLEGKSMTPGWGNTILFRSSQHLPCLRLGPSKGFLS